MITLSWNREDPKEAAAAEKAFREYTRRGWLAFVVGPDGRRRQVFSFDPNFERVKLIPVVEGG